MYQRLASLQPNVIEPCTERGSVADTSVKSRQILLMGSAALRWVCVYVMGQRSDLPSYLGIGIFPSAPEDIAPSCDGIRTNHASLKIL